MDGLIRGVEVATAPGPAVGWPDRAHDTAEPGAILPDAPGDVRGDSAFSGRPAERVSTARGGRPRTVWTSVSAWPACGRTWGSGPEALARLQAHNAEASQVRGRIEKVFGTMKRPYGLRRTRWLGLARAGLQVRPAAMAYNVRRSWRLLAAVPAWTTPGRCPRYGKMPHHGAKQGSAATNNDPRTPEMAETAEAQARSSHPAQVSSPAGQDAI